MCSGMSTKEQETIDWEYLDGRFRALSSICECVSETQRDEFMPSFYLYTAAQ